MLSALGLKDVSIFLLGFAVLFQSWLSKEGREGGCPGLLPPRVEATCGF